MSLSDLLGANPSINKNSRLSIGQEVMIPVADPSAAVPLSSQILFRRYREMMPYTLCKKATLFLESPDAME